MVGQIHSPATVEIAIDLRPIVAHDMMARHQLGLPPTVVNTILFFGLAACGSWSMCST